MTDELLDERVLRAALRLDADEIPARLDPRLIAAAARTAPRTGSDLLPAVAVVFVAGWVFAEGSRILLGAAGAALGPAGLAFAIDALTAAARVAAPAIVIASALAVPAAIAALAAVVIAIDQRRA